ncbi:MAG TPA: hypothetical protein V6C91_09865, partial [Coleofasciculaceae cyanobacterium]
SDSGVLTKMFDEAAGAVESTGLRCFCDRDILLPLRAAKGQVCYWRNYKTVRLAFPLSHGFT